MNPIDTEGPNSGRTESPHAPRDWRFWVGGTGRVLLVIGVLMFGFVGYQLWGTGIEYRQHQDALADEFTALQEALLTGTPTTATPTTATPVTTTPDSATSITVTPATEPATTAPATTTSATTTPATTAPATTAPATTAPADSTVPDSTVPGGVQEWPTVRRGQVLAIMEIPRINKRIYTLSGIRASDLKRGLGHFPSTPLPGQFGNSAFAGHRTTFGAPLFHIDRIKAGDEIIVTTITNQRYVYVVDQAPRVISAQDAGVILTTDPSVARLTITSCHPKYSAKQRIVVSAVLDEARSAPAQFPRPGADGSDTSELPRNTGDSEAGPTATDIEDLPSVTAADASQDSLGTSDTSSDAVAPADDGDGPTVGDEESESALTQGWFTDSGAWWHVVGWGALELAVVMGGWLLARRTTRRWVGVLAAAAPFVVVLYFVYQNINRLLPPAL